MEVEIWNWKQKGSSYNCPCPLELIVHGIRWQQAYTFMLGPHEVGLSVGFTMHGSAEYVNAHYF